MGGRRRDHFPKDGLETLGVAARAARLGGSTNDVRRQRVRRKRRSVGNGAHAATECSLVTVGEEQPALSRCYGLGEATDRTGDDWHVSHDRLERYQSEWLSPQRWCDEGPGVRELSPDIAWSHPPDKRHCPSEA